MVCVGSSTNSRELRFEAMLYVGTHSGDQASIGTGPSIQGRGRGRKEVAVGGMKSEVVVREES